jgi:hypothetical protein
MITPDKAGPAGYRQCLYSYHTRMIAIKKGLQKYAGRMAELLVLTSDLS